MASCGFETFVRSSHSLREEASKRYVCFPTFYPSTGLTLYRNDQSSAVIKLRALLHYIAQEYPDAIAIYRLLEPTAQSLLDQNEALPRLDTTEIAKKIDDYVCGSTEHVHAKLGRLDRNDFGGEVNPEV